MNDLTNRTIADELATPSKFTRRVFVKGLGFVSIGLLTGLFGGCEKVIEDIKNRPIRRRLRTGSAEVDADIAIYRDAVKAMKDLPASNPISWAAQAGIHGAGCCFNFCEHGTQHFFDWHRAYLLYFERICQKLTNKPKFGLPYWNWNQNPAINPAFLDSSSPLFIARNQTDMSSLSAVSNAELNPIMADTNFFTFQQQIEGTPHNLVHGTVGATMATGGSALDPVFWTHHCMIDYCWAKWNIDLGNNNTNDPGWVNHVNSHFVDTDGNPVTATAGVTTLMPLLSYQYEGSAIGGHPALVAIRDFQKLEKRLREGANIRFDVKQRVRLAEKAAITIARPISRETKLSTADFASIVNADATKEKVFVSIDFAQLPATSDFAVRVFLNLPNADRNTPTTDPHYAGSFGFFGTTEPSDRAGHRHQPQFLVNISDTLQRLKSGQQLAETTPISLQLVAVPLAGKLEKGRHGTATGENRDYYDTCSNQSATRGVINCAMRSTLDTRQRRVDLIRHPTRSNYHQSFSMMKALERVCCCFCFTIVSLASCSTWNEVVPANSNAANSAGVHDEEKLFYLDRQEPEIVQPIEASDWVERPKFVQVEVVEVINPKKHPLSFQVYYRSPTEGYYLGSFGLFPSDNPGKFIVATQGKVKKEGAIALALVVPVEATTDKIRVGVRRIKLANGQ